MSTDISIAENLQRLRQRIAHFEQKYDRPHNCVQLLAVSKTQGPEKILAAWHCGQRDFGENYVQEAQQKMQALPGRDICWHFIGPLQSNKTRAVAELFDWVHSVDRVKIAQRLNAQRPDSLPPLKILLQVNISGEASKSGAGLTELESMAAAIRELPRLQLRGLMAIPAPEAVFERQRRVFRTLAQARDALVSKGFSDCTQLSMGMSQDFEAAIAEGATLIRIGTAVFGARPPGTILSPSMVDGDREEKPGS
ncbi:MAG: YggS family pyridoxal phosphate-dependent enzyme [Pseudomonadales bacterium]|nr:YggS family pyridoxal phosphate-dependent enzyme [Pseudomonadales bacterium]